MSRKGWQKRPFTTPGFVAPPAFEVTEHPDDYGRRMEEMREELHAQDERWEREQRLTARDFTGFTGASPVALLLDGPGSNDSSADPAPPVGAPREHTSKEAA